MMGVCALPRAALLAAPIRNPQVRDLGEELERSQPKSFAAGMDMILADVLESARNVHGPIDDHTHVPSSSSSSTRATRGPASPAATGSPAPRRSARRCSAAQTAVLLSTYLRMLGHEAAPTPRPAATSISAGSPWPRACRCRTAPTPTSAGASAWPR